MNFEIDFVIDIETWLLYFLRGCDMESSIPMILTVYIHTSGMRMFYSVGHKLRLVFKILNNN